MKHIILKSIGALIFIIGTVLYLQFYVNDYRVQQDLEAQQDNYQELTAAQKEILFYVGTKNLDQATLKLKQLVDSEKQNIDVRFKLAQLYFETCKSDFENCPECEWQLKIILEQDSSYFLAKDLLKQVELLISTKK